MYFFLDVKCSSPNMVLRPSPLVSSKITWFCVFSFSIPMICLNSIPIFCSSTPMSFALWHSLGLLSLHKMQTLNPLLFAFCNLFNPSMKNSLFLACYNRLYHQYNTFYLKVIPLINLPYIHT